MRDVWSSRVINWRQFLARAVYGVDWLFTHRWWEHTRLCGWYVSWCCRTRRCIEGSTPFRYTVPVPVGTWAGRQALIDKRGPAALGDAWRLHHSFVIYYLHSRWNGNEHKSIINRQSVFNRGTNIFYEEVKYDVPSISWRYFVLRVSQTISRVFNPSILAE